MSKERRRRKAEREGALEPRKGPWRKLLITLLIVGAFGLAFYLGSRRRTKRLDAFVQCLAAKQAKMYGAYWCPHCADQKEMFGSSFQYLPYIECGIRGSRDEAPACLQEGVKHFPTWVFADGHRREGTLSLQTLSDETGCALP